MKQQAQQEKKQKNPAKPPTNKLQISKGQNSKPLPNREGGSGSCRGFTLLKPANTDDSGKSNHTSQLSLMNDFNAMLNQGQNCTFGSSVQRNSGAEAPSEAKQGIGLSMTPSFPMNFQSGLDYHRNSTASVVAPPPFETHSELALRFQDSQMSANTLVKGRLREGNMEVEEPEMMAPSDISPIISQMRMLAPKKQMLDDESIAPPNFGVPWINTPVRTRNQLRLESLAVSGIVSPFQAKRAKHNTSDFKECMNFAGCANNGANTSQAQISPIGPLMFFGSSHMFGSAFKQSQQSLLRQSSFNNGAREGCPQAHNPATFSTPIPMKPILILPHLPMVDDCQSRLHLQMSALPQLSEIPKEERVPYAYRQQMLSQQGDDLVLNTPTQGDKPFGLQLAAESSQHLHTLTPELQDTGGTQAPKESSMQMSTPQIAEQPISQQRNQLAQELKVSAAQSPAHQTHSQITVSAKKPVKPSVATRANTVVLTSKIPSKAQKKAVVEPAANQSTVLRSTRRRVAPSSQQAKQEVLRQTQLGKKEAASGMRGRQAKASEKNVAKISKVLGRNCKMGNVNSLDDFLEQCASPEFGGASARSRNVTPVSLPARRGRKSLKKLEKADSQELKPMALPEKCQCTRSRCLKLYCECFAKGKFCRPDECGCQNCHNLAGQEDTIEKAKKDIMKRDPLAFVKKLELNSSKGALQHRKGCTCKRSGCRKGYCECFQLGVTCTEWCKCTQCANQKPPSEDDCPEAHKALTLQPSKQSSVGGVRQAGADVDGETSGASSGHQNISKQKSNRTIEETPANKKQGKSELSSASPKKSSPAQKSESTRQSAFKQKRKSVSVSKIKPAPVPTNPQQLLTAAEPVRENLTAKKQSSTQSRTSRRH